MSEHYEQVKQYYDSGLWSADRVYNAIGRWITAGEFLGITGIPPENYEPSR